MYLYTIYDNKKKTENATDCKSKGWKQKKKFFEFLLISV